MAVNEKKSYTLIKTYEESPTRKLMAGSTINVFRGYAYYNGYPCEPAFTQKIIRLLENPEFRKMYIKEEDIIINKV